MHLHLRNILPNTIWCLAATAALLTAGQASAADELDLAMKSGCIACHRGAAKLIGPPYQDVAAKYAGQKGAALTLADHIVKGTGPAGLGWMNEGKAGIPFMPANGNVTPENALRLANWILGIKGEIPGLSKYVTRSLSVSGAVENRLELSVDDLRKVPAQEVKEIEVVSQSVASAGKTERFKGVPLRTLLEKAVVVSRDRNDVKKMVIVARASDGYSVVFSWNEVFNTPVGEGVLVYFERDDKPLREDAGEIAMISAKDLHLGARHVKWLQAIIVLKVVD